MANKNNKDYERLIKNFANVANCLLIYPPGHPTVENQLKNLHQQLTRILSQEKMLTLHRGKRILVINDQELMITDSTLEKIIKHFDNFKITDLEINSGVSFAELKNFLEIFSHSKESTTIYESLNMACEKNQIKNIKSSQAAYVRVPKQIKDQLDGKTIGELKLSREEIGRLISYLKGEISLNDNKKAKIYQKVFANQGILSSLIDKIIIDSANKSPEDRRKTVIIALKQIGNYLAQNSTNANKQKQNLKLIDSLVKALASSSSFIALNPDGVLKKEIDQTVENIKSLIKNQGLIAEYSKHQKKLEEVKEKLQKISPQLLSAELASEKLSPELKKLLNETSSLLKKISDQKSLAQDDLEKIKETINKIEKYL